MNVAVDFAVLQTERKAPVLDAVPSRLEVRLACSQAEVRAAQELRYRVFFEEMGAKPSSAVAALKCDFDMYDAVADHLLVIDAAKRGSDAVVGTYRLIRKEAAMRVGGFYTAGEFDIAPLMAYPGNVLELGRSCVAPAYRNRAAMQLLWQGIASYANEHDIDLLFGCASLPGLIPELLAGDLSYLHHFHLAPPELRVQALPANRVEMNMIAKENINQRRAFSSLPPLVKGYLRIGGFIGEGAAMDRDFGTIDVCLMMPLKQVEDRYSRHYGCQAKEATPE
ncbi:MAG: GNAT family N-acetyltransferase [Rhodospirillales bacterium]|nr:GNAT family N-acetyltransferase [Rhodospirillales bacterium]